jgi:hypothetical protein
LVAICPRIWSAEKTALPMMLIWRTSDFGPSLISNTRSTRFWSTVIILGATAAAKRPWRRYSSTIRPMSSRTAVRVKIRRGASLISFVILSAFSALLPSRITRLMIGLSRMRRTMLLSATPEIE